MTYSILDSILDAFGIFLFALAFFHFVRLAVVAMAQVIRERKSGWAIKRLRLPLTCLAVLLCLSALGQTNTLPQTPIGFLNTAMGYFTSHNPDLTNAFAGAGEAWTGADYQDHINVSSSIGLEYNILRRPTYNLAIESVTRNADVAGIIISEQAGIKWKLLVGGDTEVGLFVEGGYKPGENLKGLHDPFGAIGFDLKKALTVNTFAGLRFEEDFTFVKGGGFKNSQPVISAIVGFKF